MLLVHATNPKYIQDILADGKLKSFKKTGKVGEGEGNSFMDPNMVFLTVLFDFYKIFIPRVKSPVWLIFDGEKTIKSKHPEHFCAAWDWGQYEEKDCKKYSSKANFDETWAAWSAAYKNRWSATLHPNRYFFGLPSADFAVNEVVFKDSVSLDGNLVGIFALNADWEHPLLMTRPEELKEFLSKYGYKSIETHDWSVGLPRNDDLKFYKKYLHKSRRPLLLRKESRASSVGSKGTSSRHKTKSRKTLKKSKSRS